MERARPGEVVADRYEIVRALATGGMGEVLLARQLNLDRLVVLKRAMRDHSGRELRALADEARVAARLHHPNIVSILDVVDAEANPVVVLELVAGVSLRDVIDRAPGGLPTDVALAIAIDVLRGLAYAHAVRSGERTGVVHRDVKPPNVMVTFAGVTKLIDFGISRWLDARRSERTISGTQGYMAPEQERGEPADGRADQYAVGVTLREMLTGALDPDEARPIADAELAEIVNRASAASAGDRYADCGEMIAALEQYTAARGIQPSAMQVERWMADRLEDRKLDLERHTAIEGSPASPRPPTPPTVALGSQRTPRHARLSFVARNTGGPDDDWIGPVIERMVRQLLRDREDRRFDVDRADDATAIELAFARDGDGDGDGFRLEARLRDGDQVLAAAAAASVAGAVCELAGPLEARLGVGLAPIEPDPAELEAMRRLGAMSVPLLRRYRGAIHAFLATMLPDVHGLAAVARELIAEHRAFGIQSELTQCLELARALAPLVADAEAQRRYTEELADVFANLLGDAAAAAAMRFELALLDGGGALPSIEAHLAGLDEGPMRDVARRRMLRAAAVADCGSAHQAVAAGFSTVEESPASLVALGLCARRVQELELARRSFERATQLWSPLVSSQSSPYHAVLARFHLAGVLAELGDRAAARAAGEAFLRCWADPDRPLPEVGLARQLLEGDAPAAVDEPSS